MAKNKRHILYYTIKLDVTTTNRFAITVFEQMIKVLIQSAMRLRKTLKAEIVDIKEVDLKRTSKELLK